MMSVRHSINKLRDSSPSLKRDGTLRFYRLRLKTRPRSKLSSNANSKSSSYISRLTRRLPQLSLESLELTLTCDASKRSCASRNDTRRPGESRPLLTNSTMKKSSCGTRQSPEKLPISRLICALFTRTQRRLSVRNLTPK